MQRHGALTLLGVQHTVDSMVAVVHQVLQLMHTW